MTLTPSTAAPLPLAVAMVALAAVIGGCGGEVELSGWALDSDDATAPDSDPDHGGSHGDHDDDVHEEDHGLPDPEPLPPLPDLNEEELAADIISDNEDEDDENGLDDLDGGDGAASILAAPAGCERVKVVNTGGAVLRVRPTPDTSRAPLGTLEPGEVVTVLERVQGQSVNGVTRWFKIRKPNLTGFVSGAFTSCVATPTTPRFMLPLRCGRTARVTQGNSSSFSHNGTSRYAFDFGLARGTPLVAVAAGRVVARRTSTRPGDPCWSGGGRECANKANYVVLQHDDGTQSIYAHLNSPTVAVGDRVRRGQQVGLSGGTGWSTGPHAHVARQQRCGSTFCQTVEMRFLDVTRNNGVPRAGDTVTSGNCD
jgi:murein DD-endopeptidase MepM/ murein hydrolase activator NlpD